MSEFDNVPPPPATTEAPADQRTMALAAHLLGIFTGFIGALIIWLINKDDAGKAFVTDQAKEALNFQITVAIAMVICMILTIVVIGAILMPIVGLVSLVFCIIAAVKANNGEAYRYPFALRLIK
ncbi:MULTISPECIES: DUF4870 domain-containing protein [Stenotrophomonas]|uniref:DUF4870 domain-containing protein n=1 Tax=Stenotrophomonas hibiscicola TaxID=86189 RepID=A0ABV0CA99_9GAMM|nr:MULTISPECIES: DUF4870 domain-containing protein [Stenotrophomonas]EQM76714.1 membrane protein [Stenotrophomonas maltophilia MF89]MBA0262681.1 DUF4870 domain-containing protein [Stenotrophomonas maltophilia]MBA0326770.1 DUF4870 domain-containing protein [Stenotrophomonas maltophilia]MBA0468296.1 DUF4870 domain-containing protein [Stenotrophomonas maltophilia]MBA0474911.1 DUF4870 domain-containing protein [Stenotrophomonas maltophilia]